MAGGSADAAAALLALDRLPGSPSPTTSCSRSPRELGSDVPFALVGGTARGPAAASWSSRSPDAGHLVVGRRAVRRRRSPRPRSTATSTGCFPDAPARARRADGAAGRAGQPATRTARRARSTTTCRPPALDLRPELGDLIDARRGRGRAARPRLRLRARPASSSCDSPTARTRGRRRRCRAPATTSCSSRTVRSPAPTSSSVVAERWRSPDGEPDQPRARLQVLRRPAAARRRLARHLAWASGSASSAATATARPPCSR